MKISQVFAILSLCCPLAVHAGNFNYSFVEGGYESYDFSGPGASQNGLGVRGSYGITPEIHAFVGFANLDDIDVTEFGVGYSHALDKKLDLYGQFSVVDYDYDDGFALAGGLRGQIADRFELGGGIKYIDLEDAQTGLFVNGLFDLTKELKLGAELLTADDFDALSVRLRYEF